MIKTIQNWTFWVPFKYLGVPGPRSLFGGSQVPGPTSGLPSPRSHLVILGSRVLDPGVPLFWYAVEFVFLTPLLFQVFGGSMVAMIGSSIACQAIPYEPGFNGKHVAWAGKFFLPIFVKLFNPFSTPRSSQFQSFSIFCSK